MVYYYMILILLILPMSYACIGYYRMINVRNLVLATGLGILACFMSFRAESVGADTCQYVWGFQQISHTPWSELFSVKIYGAGHMFSAGGYELNFEYGYRLYNKLISIISEDNQAIIIANSLLIIFLLGKLLKSHSPCVFLSIWLYITLGIFQTQMNMARNAIAILICYIGCNYIEKHDIKKFLLFVVTASFFHISSILYVPLYWLINNVKLTTKRVVEMLLVSIGFGAAFSFIQPVLVTYLPFGLGHYFIGNTSKFEGLVLGAFHLVLFFLVIMLIERQERTRAIQCEPIGIWMFIAEMLFFCIGYDIASATRMAALFGPYLIILIPNLIENGIKSKNGRLNAIVMIFVIAGIQYLIRLQINNIGSTMPYIFFWE